MDKDRVRSLLKDKRAKLAEELSRLAETAPRDPTAAVSFGKRVGDGTTEAVERLHLTSAARGLDAMARSVERALDKLDEGSYGFCDRCSEVIPAERLEAIPWATLCMRCAASRPVS